MPRGGALRRTGVGKRTGGAAHTGAFGECAGFGKHTQEDGARGHRFAPGRAQGRAGRKARGVRRAWLCEGVRGRCPWGISRRRDVRARAPRYEAGSGSAGLRWLPGKGQAQRRTEEARNANVFEGIFALPEIHLTQDMSAVGIWTFQELIR